MTVSSTDTADLLPERTASSSPARELPAATGTMQGFPGDAAVAYGQNTYYGQKVFFRARGREMHVVTIPGSTYKSEPRPNDIPHLHEILSLISELRCGMYDNALIPVALANKLVSLRLLQPADPHDICASGCEIATMC